MRVPLSIVTSDEDMSSGKNFRHWVCGNLAFQYKSDPLLRYEWCVSYPELSSRNLPRLHHQSLNVVFEAQEAVVSALGTTTVKPDLTSCDLISGFITNIRAMRHRLPTRLAATIMI